MRVGVKRRAQTGRRLTAPQAVNTQTGRRGLPPLFSSYCCRAPAFRPQKRLKPSCGSCHDVPLYFSTTCAKSKGFSRTKRARRRSFYWWFRQKSLKFTMPLHKGGLPVSFLKEIKIPFSLLPLICNHRKGVNIGAMSILKKLRFIAYKHL